MKRALHSAKRDETERGMLRRRVKQFYNRFNNESWEGCYALIDPQLVQQRRVRLGPYSESLRNFKEVYGIVKPWLIRLHLHLAGASKQRDDRPFAYVYVIWQDDEHVFHMFRERWIKEDGCWFTRVVGLVPNKQEMESQQE